MSSEPAAPRATWRALLAFVLPLMAIASCELERATVAATSYQLVVHGVLSRSAPFQTVLLERTLTGSRGVFTTALPFNMSDPIVTGGGIAETGATLELMTPTLQIVRGIEVVTTNTAGFGSGVYRFALPGSQLVSGGRYRLTVRARDGKELSAETSVLSTTPVTTALRRSFDRDRDTLVLQWSRVFDARGYAVRVETPYGPAVFFTDSTSIRLSGALRHIEADEVPRAFVPGFRQLVSVSAVDSNYYDYYRTFNDPYIGSRIISRVQGGLGVFGSLVQIAMHSLDVGGPPRDPVEGSYRFEGTQADSFASNVRALTLFLESRSSRADQADILTGSYTRTTGFVGGYFGTRLNGQYRIALLDQQLLTDTVDVLIAELRGDTLVGRYLYAGHARFARRP